jgi:hypothetical protein
MNVATFQAVRKFPSESTEKSFPIIFALFSRRRDPNRLKAAGLKRFRVLR